MCKFKKLNEGEKYSHGSIGNIADFEGKIFIKDELKESSCEISFGTLAPGQAVPFFHSHKLNEENYIVLSGKGLFQVNDSVFPIEEGSVVRVAPAGKRSVRNNGREPLVILCVQYRAATFTPADASDGIILPEPVRW